MEGAFKAFVKKHFKDNKTSKINNIALFGACAIFEVQYLGHVVGYGKRSQTELKIKTAQTFPMLTTKIEFRAFRISGVLPAIHTHVLVITAPLTDLLKGRNGKCKIEWN